jgi:hypothetical protein
MGFSTAIVPPQFTAQLRFGPASSHNFKTQQQSTYYHRIHYKARSTRYQFLQLGNGAAVEVEHPCQAPASATPVVIAPHC